MRFEEIRSMIGRYNPFAIRDAIMHSSELSEFQRAKLIGMLIASQHSINPRPVSNHIGTSYAY